MSTNEYPEIEREILTLAWRIHDLAVQDNKTEDFAQGLASGAHLVMQTWLFAMDRVADLETNRGAQAAVESLMDQVERACDERYAELTINALEP